MPLKSGSSKATVKANISELSAANKRKSSKKRRFRKQIIAIALSKARESGGGRMAQAARGS